MRIVWVLVAVSCATSGHDRGTDTAGNIDVQDTPSDTSTTVTPPDPTTPDRITESFTYHAPVADVLFVVDASSSMVDDLEVLVSGLEGMVASWLSLGIDFHVGAVDIDEGDNQGRLIEIEGLRWADATHPTPGSLLVQMVSSVGDPSTNEQGTLAAYKALEMTLPGQPNEGFLRESSELAIVVFTDESDQSGTDPVSPQEFVDYLLALRPDPALVGFHSIVATTDYFDITSAIGGVAWSVGNTPYGPVLQAITDTIDPTNLFTLAGEPVPESILVRILGPDGTESELAPDVLTYDEDANTLDLMGYLPDPGAVVEISYVPATPTEE